jgi:hypothetical protein
MRTLAHLLINCKVSIGDVPYHFTLLALDWLLLARQLARVLKIQAPAHVVVSWRLEEGD